MARVDQLQKKYPSLPREFLLKFDALNHGIRDSAALDKTSCWIRDIHNYTRDHDLTLAQSVKNRPDRVRPGWVRFPSAIYMRSGLGIAVKRDSRSPYEVKEVGDGQFALFEGEERLVDVWFPGASVGEPGSEDFDPGAMLSGASHNCGIHEMPQSAHCGYFTTGDQCKYCNYNLNHDDAFAVGMRPPKPTVDEVVEQHRIRASRVRILEGEVGGSGAITDQEKQDKAVELNIDFLGRIVAVTPYHIDLALVTLPLKRKQLQRLKDVGGTITRCQMEVWDEKLFPEIVPGKSKQFGREAYKEYMLNAVDILGAGNVGCTFVGGATLMPPNGYQAWQDALDSTIEGFRWTIKNGIMCRFFTLRLVQGSVWGDDKSNLAKLPPTEFYLELALAHHQAMLEYGLYQKMNKFVMCPLDSSCLSYMGDLGMIALAGNVGNWMADRVPAEINWMAKFIASVASPA